MSEYNYEILPRPMKLGGGWRLRLLEGDVEVGGGVFPPSEFAENEAHALQLAYFDAEDEGYAWLNSRDTAMAVPDSPERQRRQDAVDFALANLGLSGFVPSDEVRYQMQLFIDGEIQLDDVLKGVLDCSIKGEP